MASIEVTGVSYTYPQSQAGVHDMEFTIGEGKIACLAGASGCGKSTLLRLIAGFLKPSHGTIAIGGNIVAGTQWLPPEKRRIGLVFQQHALFPHLSVAKNILFGTGRKDPLPKLLADFHLEDKAKRYPHELSGGEQQRVALARALAARPKALLMDEPFASIDSVLRRKIRAECIAVLRQTGVTTLIVTHDAEEAMELADHLIVMDEGRIMQAGNAADIYNHPVNAHVAALFGEVNHITDPAIIGLLTAKHAAGLLIRPEKLALTSNTEGVPGIINHYHFRGSHYLAYVKAAALPIPLKVQVDQMAYPVGGSVSVKLSAAC